MVEQRLIDEAKAHVAASDIPNIISMLPPDWTIGIVPKGVDSLIDYRQTGTSWCMRVLRKQGLLYPIGQADPWTPPANFVVEVVIPVREQLVDFSLGANDHLAGDGVNAEKSANTKGVVN